jgi:hypothetical protein
MESKFIAPRHHTVTVTGASWASRCPSKIVALWTVHRAWGVQTAQLFRRKYIETWRLRSNWHMWQTRQCESNTLTWYDIGLKKHRRIKARGRRRRLPDAWGLRSTEASDQAVPIAWHLGWEPKWPDWRYVQGLVTIQQIFIRIGGPITATAHEAGRNPKIES